MENIFPFMDGEVLTADEKLPVFREIKWDFERDIPVFENGQPVIIERLDALKVWAFNALKTERWRYEIFSPGYGFEFDSLVGQPYSDELKKSEVQTLIFECLVASPYIKAVSAFEVEFKNELLSAKFIMETVYGDVEMEV